MRFFILSIFLVSFLLAGAQEYRFHQYRVEQGLPSDVIKAVTQDSLGFFWVATDDGLVKYDGVRFTTYKNAFRSQYAKGFLHTREGQLLAFGDLDVIEIQNLVDTVVFKPVMRGQRYLSDSTVWFPKGLYQDFKGDIWVAEPQSVTRFKDNKLKRYDFGEENRSPVFVRSFSFFEDDDKNLFAVSFRGNIFRYDRLHDKFVHQDDMRLPEQVSQTLYVDHQLFIAGRNGLFAAEVEEGVIKTPTNIFPIRSVSNLLLSSDSSILVTTYFEDLYSISPSNGFRWENLYYNFNGINSCYISNEQDVWVATDKGLVLVQRNLFTLADINSKSQFVEGIAQDYTNQKIYYANKESLVEVVPSMENEWDRRVILDDKSHYFQSLHFGKHGLWAASSWNLLLLEQDEVVKKWDYSKQGNFIQHVFEDSKHNIWLSQAGSKVITMISDSLTEHRYEIPGPTQIDINYIQEAKDGIYAVGDGQETFLYFKAHGSETFVNISPKMNFEIQGDFTVVRFIIADDVFWIASSEGLLRWDRKTLTHMDFGEDFGRFPVSCVEQLDADNILFSNSFGLFRYNLKSDEYWLYDENSGLPSNTITNNGIFVAKNKELWVGTSYGLAVATRSVMETRRTRKPYCVEARVNGTSRRFSEGLNAPYGAYITLQFSPISFPENKINLQYKLDQEEDWNAIERNQLSLSNLPAGIHKVHVRAKKNTGLGWSEPTTMTVVVDSPYWQKMEFVFLVVFLIIIVAWGSFAISSAIMNQRKKYLQDQINQRTRELQRANEELTVRNTELDRFVYSASHDLSAPLKSILGLILVAKLDNPGQVHAQYLAMMERSVHKLEDFIEEVVTYSRNTRMPINLEPFAFKAFVENLLQDHEYSENFKHIKFIIEDDLGIDMVSDLTRMKVILNNLVSNAIKFHWIDNCREPFIKISVSRKDGEYLLSVEDNGRGIPREHISRIFEMFYRATDEAQGSGLGLYILKEAVVKLGGSVDATSTIDVGSTFLVKLPIPRLPE